MPVNPNDVVEYVQANQAALRKAAEALDERKAREKAAAAAATEATRALIDHGHVKAADERTLAGALNSHEKTLLLLTKLARKQTNQAPSAIGEPVGVEKAAAAGRIGYDAPTTTKSAADLAFERRIREARGL